MKIMIVDDNPKIRQIIRSLLETQLTEVENIYECNDGQEALDLFTKDSPEWVLMDIAMKPMNGFTASESIVKSHPDTKIVFVTQYDESIYRQEAKKVGARAYVLKENLLDLPGLIRNML